MKSKRVIKAFQGIALGEEREAALLGRILEAAARERRAAERGRRRGAGGRLAARLMPLAAALLTGILAFSIPGLGQAVSGWLGELFRLEEYLGALPEARELNADMAEAVQTPAPGSQDYSIRLLHETEAYELLDSLRVQAGFPAYDPEDWEWLREAVPEVLDVL